MRKIKLSLVVATGLLALSVTVLSAKASITLDLVVPACSQLLMKPYANGDFNSWGIFYNGEWIQVAGTNVDLTTREAVDKLRDEGLCQPNIAPVIYSDETPEMGEMPETSETSRDAEIAAEIPSQPLPESTSRVSAETREYLNYAAGGVVLLLLIILGWLCFKPSQMLKDGQKNQGDSHPKYWEK